MSKKKKRKSKQLTVEALYLDVETLNRVNPTGGGDCYLLKSLLGVSHSGFWSATLSSIQRGFESHSII